MVNAVNAALTSCYDVGMVVKDVANKVYADTIKVPHNFKEAMRSPQAPEWKAAINRENESLRKHDVFEAIPRSEVPNGRRILRARYVLKAKSGSTGEISVYKARLCVQGFRMVYGLDYDETYSPTCRAVSIRLVLSLAAIFDLNLFQWDVKVAFLGSKLKEDIYMFVPDGYDGVPDGHVLRILRSSLYGLKQSSRVFWTDMDLHLKKNGLCPAQLTRAYTTASQTQSIH